MFHKGDDPENAWVYCHGSKRIIIAQYVEQSFQKIKMEPVEDSNGDNEPDENDEPNEPDDEPNEPDDENQILDGPPFTISSANNINIFNSIIRDVHEIMYEEEVQQAIINSLD